MRAATIPARREVFSATAGRAAEHHALDRLGQQVAVAQQALGGEMHVGGAADRGLDHAGDGADTGDVLVDQHVIRGGAGGGIAGVADPAIGLDDLAVGIALHDRAAAIIDGGDRHVAVVAAGGAGETQQGLHIGVWVGERCAGLIVGEKIAPV